MERETTVVGGLFDRVMGGLGDALDHAQGQDITGPVVHVSGRIDVSAGAAA